ncbi:hypothetical protein DFH06DRAFT_1476235 [Mycena polygramma]|nr:hypothetical protein DFH06DRAFT_1476235 [Mycena polygramma]
MPGIIPVTLASLILESFLYGILLLLFISTVYFLATRRTLAGTKQTVKHHFTSVVFLGVTTLFMVATIHWIIVIYQAFFAFVHLSNTAAENAFYENLAEPQEVAKSALSGIALLPGDALVMYRLWIIFERKGGVLVFPILCQLGCVVALVCLMLGAVTANSTLLAEDGRPWIALEFVLSLLGNIYSTGFISYRISRVTTVIAAKESRLMWFLSIMVESAALQTLWLVFGATAGLSTSSLAFIGIANFPAIVGISNTLIHARVGLGWSQDRAAPGPRTTPQNEGNVL